MSRQSGQTMVEFALTVSVVMLLVVAVGQVAIILHYRTTLQLAAQEGAFEASLVGHEPADAVAQTRDLWARLEPGAGPIEVSASVQGDLIVVSAQATAPALVPVPLPPFTRWPVNARAVHAIERFAP